MAPDGHNITKLDDLVNYIGQYKSVGDNLTLTTDQDFMSGRPDSWRLNKARLYTRRDRRYGGGGIGLERNLHNLQYIF